MMRDLVFTLVRQALEKGLLAAIHNAGGAPSIEGQVQEV
jgi:hypothetical protein